MHCQAGQRLHMRCDHRRGESDGCHKPWAEETNQHGILSEEGSMALHLGSQARHAVTQKGDEGTNQETEATLHKIMQGRGDS